MPQEGVGTVTVAGIGVHFSLHTSSAQCLELASHLPLSKTRRPFKSTPEIPLRRQDLHVELLYSAFSGAVTRMTSYRIPGSDETDGLEESDGLVLTGPV